jgi:hypothetical protein
MLAAQAGVDPGAALAKGWLLGNGRGDFASGTAAGARVRSSQALLSIPGPRAQSLTLLVGIEGRAIVGGRSFALAPSPSGEEAPGLPCVALEEFGADPWPHWRHRAGGALFQRELLLVHGHPAVIVSFRHLEGPPVTLSLAPILGGAARPSEAPGPGEPEISIQTVPGRARLALAPEASLTLWHGGAIVPAPAAASGPSPASSAAPAAPARWEQGIVAGLIEATLAEGDSLHVIASADEHLLRTLARENRLGTPPPRTLAACVAAIEAGERVRQAAADRAALAGARETARQAHAARHPEAGAAGTGEFPGANDRRTLGLARALGLGWIERDGRASLARSLPSGARSATSALRAVRGLITLRAFGRARDELCAWGQLVREGLVPSTFDPADGRPRYQDPEPSLWLVIVTEIFARRAGEHEFVRRALYPALEQIIERFRTGTRLGVRVDDDSLLVSGEARHAMKRADLNALWYYAQAAMGQLARTLGRGEHAAFYLAWAREQQTRFNEAMWDDEGGCLYHAISSRGPVRGLSPAQVLAASQPPALLPPEHALALVSAVERDLFTPLGLRASPGATRLETEWLGPFFSAYLRVHRRGDEALARARGWLDALDGHLVNRTTGHLPVAFELRDGAALETASVPEDADPLSVLASAELLRAWVEEFDHGGTLGGHEEPRPDDNRA